MRSGLITQKVGMTRVFTDEGVHLPVTVLKVDYLQVVANRTSDTDGYVAVQLGYGKAKVKNVSKPMRGHFAKAKVEPKAKLAEFRVSEDALIEVGAELSAAYFVEGQFVDVIGTSIGKGFAGAMKRHNFGGLRASHGVSVSHRSHGAARVTVQSLKIVSTDADKGLVLVHGAVPGHAGAYVLVKDAVKRAAPEGLPFPAALKGAAAPAAEEAAAEDKE